MNHKNSKFKKIIKSYSRNAKRMASMERPLKNHCYWEEYLTKAAAEKQINYKLFSFFQFFFYFLEKNYYL